MEKWVEIRKSADFKKMASEYGISPITARILRNRDLINPSEINDYLSPGINALHDPMMLDGMDRVVFVLKEKINEHLKIRIIGDYDVDGICSTYILFKGLSFFGANTDYVIPHRIEDGYGINIKLIDDAKQSGADTIITCDNGISAYEQTEHLKKLGMTMIITDHHEVPYDTDESGNREYRIPHADAVVDPKLPGCKYPFEGICGAYVAFQTVLAYAKYIGADKTDDFLRLKEELLEFVSLATVCDVMELKDENRSLVYMGSRLISNSKNVGMRALINVTKLQDRMITPYHMGFVIGPCLNASGRLDTSLRALDLFLEEDEKKAFEKAENLRLLNEERKDMTLRETEKAFSIVDKMDEPDKVLVVYLPDCHESLAGIIAGKVRERYVRPSFVITKTEKGLKGSGRSIDAYDMFENLNSVKEHLAKFGGHKMAAGISLVDDTPDAFRQAINEACTLSKEDFYETVRIDMQLPFEYADINLARELLKLEPFGNGNEKPLFAMRHVTIISGQRIGKTGNVGKYKVMNDAGRVFEMISFLNPDDFESFVESVYDSDTAKKLHSGMRISVVVDVCYQIEINSFRGNGSVSLQMKHYR